MNCKECGNKLLKDAKFCNKCGKSVEAEKNKEVINIEYFSISTLKLAFLSIITLGIYEIYWFYKNWLAIKMSEKSDISPLGRAWFAIFYCHGLFKRVLQSAKEHGYSNSYSPGLLATIYIFWLIIANALSRVESLDFGFNIFWLILASLTFIPLTVVQKAINFNNSKINHNLNKNKKFSVGEIILTIIGIIYFGLVVLGIFSYLIPDNQISSSSSYSRTELIAEVVKEVKTSMILPTKIDETTTLTDITAEPGAIRYHYTLSNIDTTDLSNSYLKSYLVSSICENSGTKDLLDEGINIEYSYIVKGTTQRYFVSFSWSDCLK